MTSRERSVGASHERARWLAGFCLALATASCAVAPDGSSHLVEGDAGSDVGLGTDAASATPAPDATALPSDASTDASDGAAGQADASTADDPPKPPGVGLMHTAAQLEFMRAHRAQEPWQSAYAQLLGSNAEPALSKTPNPMADFDVPGGYSDPSGQKAAKDRLRQDAFAAYALALGYQLADTSAKRNEYGLKATEFLDAWASVNTKVSGDDGDLVLMYAGVTMLYAADLLMNFDGWPGDHRSAFTLWSSTVFWNSAHEIKDHANNWGAWGTLGAIASAALVGNGPTLAEETESLKQRIDESIDDNGELPEENKRTNSGMWYTYFALSSMTASAWILENVKGVDLFSYVSPNGHSLKLALDRDFFYAQHPDQWPYLLPDGIQGELWRLLYPCADQLELPHVNGWPGPVFEVMSDVYQVPEWESWLASARPLMGSDAWIYVTLMRQKQ
jgi:hypothetical protein